MVTAAPALAALVTVLAGVSGVQQVVTGVPESLGTRVTAYVTVGAWRVGHESGGQVRHDVDLNVTFGYRVAGAEPAVESDLAAAVGAFVAAYLPKLRNQLDGTVSSTDRPDFSVNGEPEYALVAGSEFRLFRGRVPVVMRETF